MVSGPFSDMRKMSSEGETSLVPAGRNDYPLRVAFQLTMDAHYRAPGPIQNVPTEKLLAIREPTIRALEIWPSCLRTPVVINHRRRGYIYADPIVTGL